MNSYQDYLRKLEEQQNTLSGPYQDFIAGRVSQALSEGASIDDPIDLTDISTSMRIRPQDKKYFPAEQAEKIGAVSSLREAQEMLVHSVSVGTLEFAAQRAIKSGIDVEDAQSQAMVSAIGAIRTYDQSKGSFMQHVASNMPGQGNRESDVHDISFLNMDPARVARASFEGREIVPGSGVFKNDMIREGTDLYRSLLTSAQLHIHGQASPVLPIDMIERRAPTAMERHELTSETSMGLRMMSNQVLGQLGLQSNFERSISTRNITRGQISQWGEGNFTGRENWQRAQSMHMARRYGLRVGSEGRVRDYGTDPYPRLDPHPEDLDRGTRQNLGVTQKMLYDMSGSPRAEQYNPNYRAYMMRGAARASALGQSIVSPLDLLDQMGAGDYVGIERQAYGVHQRALAYNAGRHTQGDRSVVIPQSVRQQAAALSAVPAKVSQPDLSGTERLNALKEQINQIGAPATEPQVSQGQPMDLNQLNMDEALRIQRDRAQEDAVRSISGGPRMSLRDREHTAARNYPELSMRNAINQALGRDVRDYLDEGAGSGATAFRSSGQAGGVQMFNQRTGELMANEGQVAQGFEVARSAVLQSMSSGMPDNPRDMLGTIISRVNKTIHKMYDTAIKEAEGPAQEKAITAMKNVTNKAANAILRTVGSSTTDSSGQTGDLFESVRGMTTNLSGMSREGAQDFLRASSPQLQSAVNQFGFNRAMSAQQSVWFSDDAGGGVSMGGGWGGGGGGRGGGGRGGGQGRYGSGNWGEVMYGMYVGQRLWGYTGGPVMEAANKYATGLQDYQGMYRQAFGDFAGTDLGAAGRSQAFQGFMGQAAFQQFGAIGDLGYMMMDQPNAMSNARGSQTVMGGAGVGLTGRLAGGMITKIGLESGSASLAGVGGAIGTAGLVLGGTLMGLGVANEAANRMFGAMGADEQQMGLGERISDWGLNIMASSAGAQAIRERGGTKARALSYRATWAMPNLQELIRSGAGISEEDVLDQMSGNAAEIYGAQIQEEFSVLKSVVTDLTALTGDEKPKATAAMTGLLRATDNVRAAQTITQDLGKIAQPYSQSAEQLMTLAGQRGILPGDTAEMLQLSQDFTGTDDRGRVLMQEEGQVIAGIGGMLAPYMNSPSAARALASEYELSSQAGMRAQTYMAAGTHYGADMNQIVAYKMNEAVGDTSITPITLAEQIAERAKERGTYQASLDVGVASMFRGTGMEYGEALGAAERFGIETEGQMNVLGSWGKQYETMYGQAGSNQMMALAGQSVQQNVFQSGLIGSVANRMMMGGMDPYSTLSGLGMSNQGMSNLTRAISGDFKAASYMHATGQMNLPGLAMFNRSGQQMIQTSGRGAVEFAQGQYGDSGNVSASRFLSALPGIFEDRPDLLGTFMDQGVGGVQEVFREEMHGLQMAGIGIGFAKIAETEGFLFGADRGGTWDDPAGGSMWQLQDVQRKMQHKSTLAGFRSQRQRMDFEQEYAIASEGLQERQMGITHGFQDWQSGFNRTGALQQRGWAQQDWQFQDQMTDLQFGWQMEDMDEAIRMTGGRSRRKLVEQKERATLVRNLEGQQTEETRGRQEDLWAREDERYEKQTEYTTQLQALEEERFEMQVNRRQTLSEMDEEDFERQQKEYEQMRKLNERMIKLQREHQAAQLNLQKASLGVQAAMAEKQKEQDDILQPLLEKWSAMTGEAEMMAQYDTVAFLKPFTAAIRLIGEQDPASVHLQTDLFMAVSQVGTENPAAVTKALQAYEGASQPAAAVERMLGKLTDIDAAGVNALKGAFAAATDLDSKGIKNLTSFIKAANNVNYLRVRYLTQFVNSF